METHMQDEKYAKAKYKIILMGILRDGRKVSVILDNIDPYFEIRIPDGPKEEQAGHAQTILDLLEAEEITTPIKKSIISAKPFKYYQQHKSKFLRVYYNKTKNRNNAIQLIRRNGYSTTTDDTASYYRVVCRDHLTTFSSWAILDNYSSADVQLIKGETYRLDIANYKPFVGELTGDLLKDKTLSCCWDIETWSKDGDVPMPENPDHNVFCVSMTFQWVNESQPFLKVCLVDLPAHAKQDYLTIVCGTEKNIIRAFSEVFALMRPEFIFGFNDSDYDWNWIIKRAANYKGLLSYIAGNFDSTRPFAQYTDTNVLKWNFKKEHVKVEADSYVDGFALMMHGYIPVDVRTIFRRLYPTAEQSSLSWFLAKNKLGGKEDMPYEKMFKIYGAYIKFLHNHENELEQLKKGVICDFDTTGWESDEIINYNKLKSDLADINYYCIIDAQRCHDLVKIRSVVMDHREVSNLAYTSVYDAFYRANGMKVRNLTIAIGQTDIFGIRFTNITNTGAEDGKYPGAFVFPPKKGLKTTKLSMEERIAKAELTKSKLSPSISGHNMNQAYAEWLDTKQEEIDRFKKIIEKYGAVVKEEALSSIEADLLEEGLIVDKLPKKFKQFWTESIGRPIAGLDFASLYPSLIRTYNFSPEYCIKDKKQAQAIHATGQRLTKTDFDFNGQRRVAYFVWHNNKLNPKEEGFQMGVYPYILDDLFNKRSILKKKMKSYDHRKEEIEAMPADVQNSADISAEYADVVFNKNYLNSKQNALKVFMNTFYGEAGNKLSPFFVLEVAGGITTYGQKNIKFAFAFVKEKGCEVYYGDSVIASSDVLVSDLETTQTMTIEQLYNEFPAYEYNNGKTISFPLKDRYIWSDKGWTKIRHVIKHSTNKKLYFIKTPAGSVTCTEDHSLLDENANLIKPGHVVIGQTKLLYKTKPGMKDVIIDNYVTEITEVTKYVNTDGVAINDTNFTESDKISVIPQDVYDVETENHHFAAGIGNLVVHNTDSLYISVPEKVFSVTDIEYYTGKISKIEYWTKLVEISFKEINAIRDGVNAAFIADNGTKFLSMAYEEFLYPVAFTAKKKYFGIAHENLPNFTPKELFIRGLEVKKRGVSDLLRKIFMEIMWTTCNPSNLYDLFELVTAKIDDIYARKWKSTDFVQTGVYRPTKQNVKINTFVERMKQRGIDVKPNERFYYVLVKKYPYTYDARGRKKEISIGDKLEYAEVAERDGMEVDLDYYMQGSVNGQLARLITYHDMFHVDPLDGSDSELKVAEDRIYKNACKFVESYCERYYANYNTFGKTHQKIFKTANKASADILSQYDNLASELLGANVDFEDFESWFVEYTEKIADKLIKEYGKDFVLNELSMIDQRVRDRYCKETNDVDGKDDNNEENKSDTDINPEESKEQIAKIKHDIKQEKEFKLKSMQKAYYGNGAKSLITIRELAYKNTMSILRKRLRENLETFTKIYRAYNKSLEDIMQLIRGKVGITDELFKPTKSATDYKLEDLDGNALSDLSDEIEKTAKNGIIRILNSDSDIASLAQLKALYNHMLAAHITIKRSRSIVSFLKLKRDQSNRAVVRPDDDVINKLIKDSMDVPREHIPGLLL
jgi:DNA polymerase elongation subunit (family B)